MLLNKGKTMKIILWVCENDAISGKITKYYYKCPDAWYTKYVQIEISQLEFAQMVDKSVEDKIADISDRLRDDDWLVNQHNRNKKYTDQITDVSQIKK